MRFVRRPAWHYLACSAIAKEDGSVVPPLATWGDGSPDLDTTKLDVTPSGRTLYELMGLEQLPDSDKAALLNALRVSSRT